MERASSVVSAPSAPKFRVSGSIGCRRALFLGLKGLLRLNDSVIAFVKDCECSPCCSVRSSRLLEFVSLARAATHAHWSSAGHPCWRRSWLSLCRERLQCAPQPSRTDPRVLSHADRGLTHRGRRETSPDPRLRKSPGRRQHRHIPGHDVALGMTAAEQRAHRGHPPPSDLVNRGLALDGSCDRRAHV